MTDFLTKNLKQTVVYWGTPAADGYGGYTYADPVELDARWEEKQELFVNASGKDELSRAVVYLGSDVEVDGFLYLGELDDLDSDPVPQETATTYKIRAYSKIPDRKGLRFLRKVWLT